MGSLDGKVALVTGAGRLRGIGPERESRCQRLASGARLLT